MIIPKPFCDLKKDQITDVWSTCFRRYDVLTKCRSEMATAISFSRQNGTGSLALALCLLRKLVVVLVLALEFLKVFSMFVQAVIL